MIYVVSLYYHPLPNPPANRMRYLVEGLVEKYGADNIIVVTGRPNYPTGVLPSEFRWRPFLRKCGVYGEQVHHCYEYATPFEGKYKKTLGLLSFSVSVFFYFLFRRIRKGDLLFVTSGPVFYVYAIWFLKKFKRKIRYVFDVRDMWPQQQVGMGFLKESSVVYKIMAVLTRASYRKAEKVTINCPDFAGRIQKEVPEVCPYLMYNPVDPNVFNPAKVMERLPAVKSQHVKIYEGKTNFIFHGYFSRYLDIELVLHTLKSLKEERMDWSFVFIGDGDSRDLIASFIKEHGMEDLIFLLEHMDKEVLLPYIVAADYGFTSVNTDSSYDVAFPTKLAEFLACDKPIVAMLPVATNHFVEEHCLGVTAERGDLGSLLSALTFAIENKELLRLSGRGREIVREHFSTERFKKTALDVIEDLTSTKSSHVAHDCP